MGLYRGGGGELKTEGGALKWDFTVFKLVL